MLTVKTSSLDDVPAIALLGRTTFAETFEHLFAGHADDLATYLDATFAPAKIVSGMAKTSNFFWLAEWNDVPIGYAKLKLESRHPLVAGAATAQLQKIYVLRDHLNCGAGKALQGAVLDHARQVRCDQLWLTVLESNRRAIEFYLRNGWKFAAKDSHRIGAQAFTYDVLRLSL